MRNLVGTSENNNNTKIAVNIPLEIQTKQTQSWRSENNLISWFLISHNVGRLSFWTKTEFELKSK